MMIKTWGTCCGTILAFYSMYWYIRFLLANLNDLDGYLTGLESYSGNA